LDPAFTAAGVDFHALRGTAASNMVLANVAPAVTMAVLGHRNIATTMKHYTSVEVEHKKQAMHAVFG